METLTNPVCFGVMCGIHGECQRYKDVDGAGELVKRIGTCGLKRELFIPIKEK